MYADRWLGDPSALDIQPSREDKLAQQQLDRLIAAGLVSRDSPRSRSRPKQPAAPQRERGECELQPVELPLATLFLRPGWLTQCARA